MNIVTSQKTTTAFSVALDAADVQALLIQALRDKLNVPDGYPGVTTSVDLGVDASGSITGTVMVEVEAVIATPDPASSPIAPAAPVVAAGAAIAPVQDAAPAVLPPSDVQAPSFAPGFLKAT